ncbi:MAG: transposase [Verrucomicrobiales bacterium]
MARSIRIEIAGAFYHVMARGNRRQAIFRDDDDRRFFLQRLGEACAMTGWRLHAWVLMNNHYHLLIETPEPNLVAGMQWLQNRYTRRFNVRHRARGRVFGDRYKAVLVQGKKRFYYQTVLDYIHLNVVRAGLVKASQGQSVVDYPWSSLSGGYALRASRRPKWLAGEAGLAAFGFRDNATGRRKMVERLDGRAVEEGIKKCGVPVMGEEVDARCSHLGRGWYWGGEEFAEKMLGLAQGALQRIKSRAYRSTGVRRAHDVRQAERWLREGLAAAGLSTSDLKRLKGSDPRKLALARLLWQKTAVSQGWLAEKLHLRSAANVSQQLRRLDIKRLRASLPRPLKAFLDSLGP